MSVIACCCQAEVLMIFGAQPDAPSAWSLESAWMLLVVLDRVDMWLIDLRQQVPYSGSHASQVPVPIEEVLSHFGLSQTSIHFPQNVCKANKAILLKIQVDR